MPRIPEPEHPDTAIEKHEERLAETTWFEVGKNSVDFAHFHHVHGTSRVTSWELFEEGPVLRIESEHEHQTPFGKMPGRIITEQHGPGIGIVRGFGASDSCVLVTITPIDDRQVRLRFTLCVSPRSTPSRTERLVRHLMQDLMVQVDEDIAIWRNKQYLARPLLTSSDGPIARYRSWANQFVVD